MNVQKHRNLFFVLNPIAGDIEKDDLKEDLENLCGEHSIRYDIYTTTGEKDKEAIERKLKENKYDAVYAIGGDGTVSLVASLLIGTSTPLGIIPLGSGNGLSKDLDIPQDTEEALQLIHTHVVRNIDTVTLNGKPSIHLSDIGFNALVVERFCEGDTRGPGAYAWIALQEYLSYEPKSYRIETDTDTFEGKAFMVTVANANAWGSNASINPDGILNDGMFEICLIEPFPRAASIGILYKLYTDSIDTSVYTRILKCRRATIYNPDLEVMHIDGEPVPTAAKIEVEMHAKSLKVILPAAG
ncbi:diacylglycerol/lipid kinase family protein [Pontibacter litorisediminis]|uniref:diacylglycerol/lipid kinase family protein n=1 Tax=Pontibacter litorisediminis TaxID=1846260 RepID=UPI0023EB57F4|nr:diacylglycerol kinase family protein [Pontibacter litorisediminis]